MLCCWIFKVTVHSVGKHTINFHVCYVSVYVHMYMHVQAIG